MLCVFVFVFFSAERAEMLPSKRSTELEGDLSKVAAPYATGCVAQHPSAAECGDTGGGREDGERRTRGATYMVMFLHGSFGSLCRAVAPVEGRSRGTFPGGATYLRLHIRTS